MSIQGLVLAAMIIGAGPDESAALESPAGVDRARRAVARSLPFLQVEGEKWIEEKKCISCHHTSFLTWSHLEARRLGLPIDERRLDGWIAWSIADSLALRDDGDSNGTRNIEGLSQLILGRDPDSGSEERTTALAGFARTIIEEQQPDGSWKPGGQLPEQKRPKRETTEVSTMWIVLALSQAIVTDGAAAESRSRALQWLESAKPGASTEWWVARLLVERELGRGERALKIIEELLERQNPDGGWGWAKGAPSDALATGQSLYGLIVAGLERDHPAIQRARRHLIETQGEDGAWVVNSTLGKKKDKALDTSIFFGTAWAAIGLARSLPEPAAARRTGRF